jgi:hypothetical protein
MTDISSDKFNSDNCIKNISKICNQSLEELPYWETIQDVFINIKTDELRDIQKYIVKTLIRSKMFDKYKYNNYFQLVVDGTGLSNHTYNLRALHEFPLKSYVSASARYIRIFSSLILPTNPFHTA